MPNASSAPPDRADRTDSAGKLTIGALSRATGVPVETLRTWEMRYGFPAAERKPSGHRVYAPSVVPRLRRILEAIRRGHRAGEVVGATDADLDRLTEAGAPGNPSHGVLPPSATVAELLDLVRAFDGERLTTSLLADWGRLSPVAFVTGRIAPLITGVGDGWAAGQLDIRHEHFLSERVGDLLRTLRLPFDLRAAGPQVICATAPGEAHGLGLQMAALVLSAAGLRVTYLGTDVPPTEIAALARELAAGVVAVSVSEAADRAAATSHLTRLRDLLPRTVTLLLGGTGAPDVPGAVVIGPLPQLDAWARRLAAAPPSRKGR